MNQSSEKQAKLKIKIYDNFEEMQYLKERWNDLLVQSTFPNIFLTWEWITTWWKWFGTKRRLTLAIATEGNVIVGITPMCVSKISILPGIRVQAITIIGDGSPVCPDYLTPITKEEDIMRVASALVELFREMMRDFRIVRFAGVLSELKIFQSILKKLKENYIIDINDGELCPQIYLPPSYDAFLMKLSKKRRKRIKYELRRTREKYSTRLECYKNSQSVNDAFTILNNIYMNSKRGQNPNIGFKNASYLGFHIDIAKAFAEKGWLRFYVLWLNDTPAAFIYGYLYNNTFWFYQTAFDMAFRKYAVGSVILQLVIESLIVEGVEKFDFLRGNETYKLHLADNYYKLKTVTIFRRYEILYYLQIGYKLIYNLAKKLKQMGSVKA